MRLPQLSQLTPLRGRVIVRRIADLPASAIIHTFTSITDQVQTAEVVRAGAETSTPIGARVMIGFYSGRKLWVEDDIRTYLELGEDEIIAVLDETNLDRAPGVDAA